MNSLTVITNKMKEDNFAKLAKHTLALHKTLTKCDDISNEFHEEINSLIHKIMDVIVRTSLDYKIKPPQLRKGVLEEITKGARRSSRISSSVNGTSAIRHKIKSCRVILHKISSEDLKKYLCSKSVIEELPSNTVIPQEMVTTKGPIASEHVVPEFIATEEHLDLLMAKEMKMTLSKMEQRLNQTPVLNYLKPQSINPVIKLKKLSTHFITQALTGKSQQTPEISSASEEKAKIAALKVIRKSDIVERRRSGRSSVIKNGCRCCPDESLLPGLKGNGNQENTMGNSRNKFKRKGDYSDDEEFYGFELPEKNNENFEAKFGDKNPKRQKTPLKAINSIVRNSWVPIENISIFKDQRSPDDDTLLSGIDLNVNGRNCRKDVFLKQIHSEGNGVNEDDKLKILKQFKQRVDVKLLMNRLTVDQGKVIESDKLSDDNTLSNSFTPYSDDFYLKKTGKRIPLWAEENVRKFIMLSQDEIPTDIIADYFHRPPPLSLASLFTSDNCS